MANFSRRRLVLWAIPAAIIVSTGIVLCVLAILWGPNCLSSASSGQVNENPDGFTLHHVTIVHRHGLRAPAHLSVWSNAADYPMGIGYLTAKGKQGSLLVGGVFRRFYKDFLSDSPREVWARSSTYPRCFETEYLLLSTMYPPTGFWKFGYPVQPIPITMVPDGNDVHIEACGADVPGDFEYMYNETHRELKEDGFETVRDFMRWLQVNSGYSTEDSKFFEPIIDALYAQKFNGLTIPKWAETEWKSMDWAMRRLSFDYWKFFVPYYGEYMGKTIAARTQGAASNTVKQKLSIMSYHDTTIQAILSALKFDYVELYPSFLGALHFQLYTKQADGQFYVRTVFHQGFTASGEYRDASEITIKDCPFPDCPLAKFVEIMNNLYPDVDRSSCPPIDQKALL